ncbi:MAG: hypothetical protein ACLQNE_21430, partial [Thermoguttaceae bacterium]
AGTVFPKKSPLRHKVSSFFEEHFCAIPRKFKLKSHFATDTNYPCVITPGANKGRRNIPGTSPLFPFHEIFSIVGLRGMGTFVLGLVAVACHDRNGSLLNPR